MLKSGTHVTAQHAGERDDLAKRGHAAQVPLRAGEGALRVLPDIAHDRERVALQFKLSAEAKKLYFDTVVFTEHQLRYLIETWGADHIIVGTDYPYDMAETDPVGHVMGSNLSDEQKRAILGENAAKLLKL